MYVGTLNNTLYAWNQSDGSLVWSRHLRAPQTTGWGCGGFKQGILGTPTIDPTSNRIYVVTLGADSVYRAEGLNLVTGVPELTTVVTTPAPTFDRTIQQNRGALAVANGYLYVPFGGRAGDCGAYHGYVFAVPLDGTAVTHYYVTPGQGAGFWAPGGVVVDASTGKVFETSGNGTAGGCNANSNGTPVFENDAVVRLSSILGHEDAFVPADWHDNWCINDQDLGSASMVLINPTLAFQSGKWGNGFLVNPQNLGGVNGQLFPSPTNYVGVDVCHGNNSDANFGSYAYAAPYVYLSCPGHGIVALKVDTAAKTFSACDSTAAPSWASGSGDLGPPIVAGGAVWAVDINGGGLSGFDATTGAQIFHSSAFGVNHFATPSEAGGQIFVAADREVRSFNMTSKGCPTTAGSPSAGPVRTTDLFTYGPLDGSSCVELANGSGGWAGVTGPLFASGWEFHPGHFSNSGLTDLFLYNPSTGSSYVELANGSGGWSGVAGPAFSTGWHFYPGRYSSSGLTDLFLYNPTTGTSYVELANGSGGWSGSRARGSRRVPPILSRPLQRERQPDRPVPV